MKKQLTPALAGIVIAIVLLLVGVLGYTYLRTPGPKVPITSMPVPKNPYTTQSAQPPGPQ
jgi:hypothetical protein